MVEQCSLQLINFIEPQVSCIPCGGLEFELFSPELLRVEKGKNLPMFTYAIPGKLLLAKQAKLFLLSPRTSRS